MLRETDRWASVSADPRKLADGGQYLAEVLGIWDDFQDGRPGLVSLWGTCTLAEYIREVDTRGEPILTILQRLDLVCFFISFLSPCQLTTNKASKVAQGVHYRMFFRLVT